MKVRVLLLVPFLILAAGGAPASDAPMDRATLRGLKAVKAVVDAPASVTSSKLAAQIEQRLAKAGIPVDSQALEFVGLRVTFAHARKTDYALAVTLSMYQNVTLARDPAIKNMAETWSGESVLLVPPKMLNEALANTVDLLVDQFIAAWQSANPK